MSSPGFDAIAQLGFYAYEKHETAPAWPNPHFGAKSYLHDLTLQKEVGYGSAAEATSYAHSYSLEPHYNGYEAPYFPQVYPISDEVAPRLRNALWEQSESLSLTSHMVLYEGKGRPPKAIHEYGFAPVLHRDPLFLTHNLSSVGYNLLSSTGVRFEYGRGSDGMPYMDGRFGLGLTFRDRLVALCAGGLAKEGPIIQQLQDVSSKLPPSDAGAKQLRSFRYANGLHSGLDWKTTLARGWCTLMSQALPDVLPDSEGRRVWVQSAENNIWVKRQIFSHNGQPTGRYMTDHERLARLSKTYDGTARKLGSIICDPQTRNLPLPKEYSVGRAA